MVAENNYTVTFSSPSEDNNSAHAAQVAGEATTHDETASTSTAQYSTSAISEPSTNSEYWTSASTDATYGTETTFNTMTMANIQIPKSSHSIPPEQGTAYEYHTSAYAVTSQDSVSAATSVKGASKEEQTTNTSAEQLTTSATLPPTIVELDHTGEY